MLRLNLGKTKQKDFYTLRKPGFTIPPENYLYECRPPEEVKIAPGPIIRNKYGKVKVRGGPANLGKVSGDLSKAPRQNVRNVFLPQRQSFNRIAPRTSRISEEEQKQIREEDVARNGQLIQVSNKTLNRVFDKFGLFTISDKILEMSRSGKMSKEDVRASALLKLTKEVMNAMREARVDEAKEAIDRIEEKHPGTIPKLQDLGNSPEEIAENPLLPLSMMLDAGIVNDETFLFMEKLIEGGYVYIDPDTLMIDDIIPLHNILQFSLDEIKEGVENMRDGQVKDLLTYILDQQPDYPEEMKEEPIEEEEMELKEGEIIPKLPPPPPREIGYVEPPTPKAKPPPINPVEPTPEELKEDEVYDIVRSGNDVGEGVRKYITELNNKLSRILKTLPQKIEPAMFSYIKDNQKEYTETASALAELSRQPDSVLDDEKKQEEIQEYLNKLQDLIGGAEGIANILNVKPTPSMLGPKIEVMEEEEELEPIRQRQAPLLNPKRYDVGTPLSEDEKRNPKIKRVGTRNDVWEGLALQTGTNPRTSLRREDLVFDRRENKVKSKNAVLGAMSRRKPTRTKKSNK